MRDFQLGLLWLLRGDPHRTLPYFRHLADRSADAEGLASRTHAACLRNLAVAYRAGGKPQRADQAVRNALEVAGDDPLARGERAKAMLLLALLAADMGAADEAQRWLNEAMQNDAIIPGGT